MIPGFHTGIDDPRYGKDATEVYHNRSECQSGQKILEDHSETFGEGGRRRCEECRRFGSA
jgi:hypothetical protein